MIDTPASHVASMVLAAVHQLAADLARLGASSDVPTVSTIVPMPIFGVEVEVAIRPLGMKVPTQTQPGSSPSFVMLSPMQQKIVALLDSAVPHKAAWLAIKLGKAETGSFRGTLSNLVRMGVAVKAPRQGYLLAPNFVRPMSGRKADV